jgi:hypothetical protein
MSFLVDNVRFCSYGKKYRLEPLISKLCFKKFSSLEGHLSSIKLVQRKAKSPFDFELPTFDLPGDNKVEEVAETGGIVLSDGRCIELIRDKTGALALFDSVTKKYDKEIKCGGQIYVPPTMSASLAGGLTIPVGCAPSGSTAETFTKLCGVFTERGVPEALAQKLTYWSLSTWFTDLLPLAPCLLLTGPRFEASLILQILACVVRHGLPLGAFNLAGFQSLPMHAQPTLLISDVNPSMVKLLANSNYHQPYLTKGGLLDLYCAKALYAGPRINLALDGAFHVHVVPFRSKQPVITTFDQLSLTAEFQPRLVDYRITHAKQVREFMLDIACLSSEFRLLGGVLGAGVIDDSDLRSRLANVLQEHQDEISVGVISPEPFVIEALLNLIHTNSREFLVHIGELAVSTNVIAKGRGAEKIEPKSLGWMLRNSFNLTPKRDAKGFAIRMTNPIRQRVHQLAVAFQAWNALSSECTYCKGISGVGDEQGKPAA